MMHVKIERHEYNEAAKESDPSRAPVHLSSSSHSSMTHPDFEQTLTICRGVWPRDAREFVFRVPKGQCFYTATRQYVHGRSDALRAYYLQTKAIHGSVRHYWVYDIATFRSAIHLLSAAQWDKNKVSFKPQSAQTLLKQCQSVL